MKSITRIFQLLPRHLLLAIGLVGVSYLLILLNRAGIQLPASISLLGISLHFYGLLILAGVVAVTYFVEKLATRKNLLPPNFNTWDNMAILLILGIIGARLFHVISDWYIYQENLTKVFAVWDGGLSIFGALVVGGIALAVICYRYRLDFLKLVGVIALYMPLGQIIGRYGNFLNQELYGYPAELPWSIYIEPARRASTFLISTHFHPVFWYEQILSLVLLVVLAYFGYMLIIKSAFYRAFHGLMLFAIYLIGYGIVRMITEQVRLDPNWIGTFSFGEILSLGSIILGLVTLLISYYQLQHGKD